MRASVARPHGINNHFDAVGVPSEVADGKFGAAPGGRTLKILI